MRVGSDEEVNSEERRGSGSGSVGDGGGGGNDGDDGVIGVDGAVINQYILLTQWRNDVESPPERARSLYRFIVFVFVFPARIFSTRRSCVLARMCVHGYISGSTNALDTRIIFLSFSPPLSPSLSRYRSLSLCERAVMKTEATDENRVVSLLRRVLVRKLVDRLLNWFERTHYDSKRKRSSIDNTDVFLPPPLFFLLLPNDVDKQRKNKHIGRKLKLRFDIQYVD